MVGDFYLPLNSFYANFSFPSQEISNVNFNLSSDQSLIDPITANFDYCKVYNGNFNMSIIEDNYFLQPLTDAKISMMTNLLIDTSTLNNLETNISQTDLDNFANEVYNQNKLTNFYYSNTFVSNLNNGYFKNVYEYYIDDTSTLESYNSIQYNSNNYSLIKSPIINLMTLTSNCEFSILQIGVEFFYSTYNSDEIKTLNYSNNNYKTVQNSIDINFELKTLYDFKNNTVNKSLFGMDGFYCPDLCSGEYKVEIIINQFGSTKKIIFKNQFSFLQSNNYFTINTKQIVINDLTKFKKMVY